MPRKKVQRLGVAQRPFGMNEDQFEMLQLQLIEEEIRKREALDDPKTYGLPDLCRPAETEEELADPAVWRARQNREMKEFVEKKLFFVKDGSTRRIVLNGQMLNAIADLFYGRVRKAIWWKPRGGGGSLGAAVLIFLCLIFRKMSILDMAGSGEQAKNVYEYVKQFWECFPDLRQKLIKGDPLVSRTELVNGVTLKCVGNSEKQGRGKHLPGLVCDEACQRDTGSDVGFESAIQGTLSEPNYMVLLLSTFHHPVGIFQEYWDGHEEKGFARYRWDVYDTMAPCTIPKDENGFAEDGVPNDCKKCPLTRFESLTDAFGNMIQRWNGCNGRARFSDGFQTFDNVMEAKKLNRGTKVFEIEFECNRPDYRSRVIEDGAIDAAIVKEIKWSRTAIFAVGIDWGLVSQTAVLLGAQINTPAGAPDYIGIIEAEFMTGKLVGEVIQILLRWRELIGTDFQVFADASHPYNNQELLEAGFEITAVNFGKYKPFAYGNLVKFFIEQKLKMMNDMPILEAQLRGLKRDKTGNIVKKDDHGPDALANLLMRFPFLDLFPQFGGADLGSEDVVTRLF